MMIHSVIHVYKGKRESGERWTSLSSKILIFFKKKNQKKKKLLFSFVSFVCPDFFQKSTIIIIHHRPHCRERERERKGKKSGTKSSSLRLVVFPKGVVQ